MYSADITRPLQQGDLMISSGITRTVPAGGAHTPPAWASFSASIGQVAPAVSGAGGLAALGGRALVMVVSHDCHLDKEANQRARTLMKVRGLDEDTAFALAEDDDSLDRHVVVSPVVQVDSILEPADASNRGLLARGRLLGYYPLADDDSLGLAGVVVDLGLRATVDRMTLNQRLVSLTDPARIQLRYALARMDSLRTPDIGHELDLAVGQRITKVLYPNAKRPTVALALEDGTQLELLPRPGDTPLDGPRRAKSPSRRGARATP